MWANGLGFTDLCICIPQALMKMDEDGNGSRASHHFEIPSLVPRLILNISPSCTLKKCDSDSTDVRVIYDILVA